MNNELHKNSEGYTDPTAAATLSRKEPGDVWTYKDQECLIIKGHAGFATALRLHCSNPYGDRVKITDRPDGPRYVDPAFIITCRYSEMGLYVETLDVEDFKRVIQAVGYTMGLQVQTREPDKGELAQLQEDLRAMQDLAVLKQAVADAANKAATKAQNQLELLREMYNDLLDRVASVEEGAQ